MEKIWQNPNVLQSTPKHNNHPPPPPPPPPPIQNLSSSPASLVKLTRRQLAISTKSSLLLLLFTSPFQHHFYLQKATAQALEDNPIDTSPTQENPVETSGTANPIEDNPVETGGATSLPEDNLAETGGATSPTEDSPIEISGTTSPTQDNAVETNSITTGDNPDDNNSDATTGCTDKLPTKRAFLDVSIDGQPIGRIIIGLYGNNVPAGTTRFSDFVSGGAGVSYRRKEFVKITPSYIQHGGVRSYGVDAELAAKTGKNFAVENLISELESTNGRCPGTKNVAGTVGIIVRDPLKPPPKQKLVARNGKLVIDEEEIGKDPNGTEFVISTKDSPELDASTLVIGKVLDGMEVVERMGQVKTVQENTSSPYFRVAKLIGDKRAVVAERGFNRPYSKVVVTNCGLMA